MQRVFIPGVVPSSNKFATGKRIKTKTGKVITPYASAKKAWTQKVFLLTRGLKPAGPSYFTFVHQRPDRRTDPDNFCAPAQKVTLDGLQKAGVIKNDGWEDVLGLAHYWTATTPPGFWLLISDAPMTFLDAWAFVHAPGHLSP